MWRRRKDGEIASFPWPGDTDIVTIFGGVAAGRPGHLMGAHRMQQDLSELEISIVRALARGLQSKEIASVLECNRTAVEFRIRMLFVKMDAKSRAQLVARGYDMGFLPVAPS